jgi:hypothetical protein
MANTYTLINSVTVGSGGANSITFSSIPSTFTDLVLKYSARATYTNVISVDYMAINGSSSGINSLYLGGYGSSAYSGVQPPGIGVINEQGATANTFSSNEIYIPNYAGSLAKSMSSDNSGETNSSSAGGNYMFALSSTSTSPITSITITPETGGINPNPLLQYSSFYLYGISNS